MRLKDLQPASFRGARFYVPRDTAEEGRQTIEHNYPDSAVGRYLEDNGYLPPNFKISAILFGDNLSSDWARLRRALTTPGQGTLQHPWYGRHRVSVMGRFTVTREDRESGVLRVEISFGAGAGGGALPSLIATVPAMLGGLAASSLSQIAADMGRLWPEALNATNADILSDAFVTIADAIVQGISVETPAAIDVRRQSPRIVTTPTRPGPVLTALHAEPFDVLSISAETLTRTFKSIADVADDLSSQAAAVRVRTRQSEALKETLTVLADHTRAAAFVGAAWAMADRQHRTSADVETDEMFIDDAFGELQDSATLSAEARNTLSAVHIAIGEVLADRILRLPRVSARTVRGVPASVLGYSLYDSPARSGALVDLNPDQNPIWMEGDIKVLIDER